MFQMTRIALLFAVTLSLTAFVHSSPADELLPEDLRSKGLSLGMTLEQLKQKRPDIQLLKTESFREVYGEKGFSAGLEYVVYYVAADAHEQKRVYEFILTVAQGREPGELGRKAFGPENHLLRGNREWRFPPEKTGLTSELAAWTFNNKLVIAFAMPGSEWEPGFDQNPQ